MKLKLWQVDAFTDGPFGGNPAAIVPLERWLPDALMQNIAAENNLSETAFFVPTGEGEFHLRWFTPAVEVDLCGHATFASAWLLFEELAPQLREIRFTTRSGVLTVTRGADRRHRMSLPANRVARYETRNGFAAQLGAALSLPTPVELHRGKHLVAVWDDPEAIRSAKLGDLTALLEEADAWALIISAGGPRTAPYDFISRFFSIGHGIPEDPVTGSAHCTSVPFWAQRLGKKTLRAFQASKRGGELLCTDEGARVTLSGACVLYLRGEIAV